MTSSSNPETSLARTPLRIFVFDSPRCCSHLFRKVFSQHHQLGHILEPYLVASVVGPQGVAHALQCSSAARDTVNRLAKLFPEREQASYDNANASLIAKIHEIEKQGKVPWVKDHAIYSIKQDIVLATLRSSISVAEVLQQHPNPTKIDNKLLESLTPVFLIRHPALVVRSYWQVNVENVLSDAEDEQFKWMISVRWVRILFDYFRQQHAGRIPLVIDAEDVVYRTSELADALCQHLGLDADGVILQWKPEGHDPNDAGHFFHARLRESAGIERTEGDPSEKDLDLDAMAREWEKSWGSSVSGSLKRLVQAELPDYEYLRSYKLSC